MKRRAPRVSELLFQTAMGSLPSSGAGHPGAVAIPLPTFSSCEGPTGARRNRHTHSQMLKIRSLSFPLLQTAGDLRADLGSGLYLLRSRSRLHFIDCRELLLSFMGARCSQVSDGLMRKCLVIHFFVRVRSPFQTQH